MRQEIIVCPLDHAGCKEEMSAIEVAAAEGKKINPDNPMLPLPTIVRVHDPNALRYLGVAIVGNMKKPVIE